MIINGTSEILGNINVNPFNPHHILISRDGVFLSCYVDGELAFDLTVDSNASTFINGRLGCRVLDAIESTHANVTIADYEQWERSLIASEALLVYNQSELILHYDASETSGYTIYDDSGNDNHGSLIRNISLVSHEGPASPDYLGFKLNGIDDYINIDSESIVTNNVTYGSVLFWASSIDLIDRTLFGNGVDANNSLSIINSTTIRYIDSFGVYHDIVVSALITNRLYHFALSKDDDEWCMND